MEKIGNGIEVFGYSGIIVRDLVYRNPLGALGLLADKVGTALYTSLDIKAKHLSLNGTYQRDETAQSSLLLGRAGALEVLKAGGSTAGDLAVESSESSDVGGAALGVDEELAGAVGLQGEKGRGSHGSGGGSQSAQGDDEDAGGVHGQN